MATRSRDGVGFPAELLDTRDTVTHVLEMLTGEVLVADVVRQELVSAAPGNRLDVAAGQTVMHRIAVLRGRDTELAYVYAESVFLPERLPEQVGTQLAETDDTIGRILGAHGLTLTRESSTEPQVDPELELVDDVVFTRAYRLLIDGQPVFAIREWFLRPALEAFDRKKHS